MTSETSGRPAGLPDKAGPSAGVRVRQADGNDLDAVVAVGRQTWPAVAGPMFEPDLVELFLAKWWTTDAMIPSIRAGRTLVAEVDGQVVGMASYGAHDGHQVIWKLYVLPEHQGHGIGGQLLAAVVARLDDEAIFLSYTDGNTSAADFTRSHGFVIDRYDEQHGMPDLVWTRRDPGASGLT